MERLIIIGGGPAGYTAAIYAARAGLNPLVIEGPRPGGQLTITTEVENYPGFSHIDGTELVQRMRKQAEENGARFLVETVQRVDIRGEYKVIVTEGEQLSSQAVIIATGANAKWLGVPGEQQLMGRGISACATCDGPMLSRMLGPDAEIAVIGGGDTACEEALYLAGLSGFSKIHLIHRRGELRASKVMQDRVFAHPKIEMVWNRKAIAFLSDETGNLTVIQLAEGDAPAHAEPAQELRVRAAFVAIGHTPATDFLKGQLELTDEGYIITLNGRPEVPRDSDIEYDQPLDGVYAAGDCADSEFRQAVTAAGMGCQAAILAERYLSTMR